MKYLNKQLSAAMWSRVMLLWLVLAIASLVLGIVVIQLSGFVGDNIEEELALQDITFPEEERMSDAEKDIDGLVDNAGEKVLTGNQAEIYSNYILLHVQESAEEAGYPDASYANLGGVTRGLRADLAEARESGDEDAIAAAEAKLDEANGLRDTFYKASNLRASLYAAYGWDNVATGMGVAGIALIVLFGIFGGLFVFEWRRGHLPVED